MLQSHPVTVLTIWNILYFSVTWYFGIVASPSGLVSQHSVLEAKPMAARNKNSPQPYHHEVGFVVCFPIELKHWKRFNSPPLRYES